MEEDKNKEMFWLYTPGCHFIRNICYFMQLANHLTAVQCIM